MLNSMSKRTDNLETLHIALELLRRIPRGSKISAPELRQQLAHVLPLEPGSQAFATAESH